MPTARLARLNRNLSGVCCAMAKAEEYLRSNNVDQPLLSLQAEIFTVRHLPLDFAALYVQCRYIPELTDFYLNQSRGKAYYDFYGYCLGADRDKSRQSFVYVKQLALQDVASQAECAQPMAFLAKFYQYNQIATTELTLIENRLLASEALDELRSYEIISRNVSAVSTSSVTLLLRNYNKPACLCYVIRSMANLIQSGVLNAIPALSDVQKMLGVALAHPTLLVDALKVANLLCFVQVSNECAAQLADEISRGSCDLLNEGAAFIGGLLDSDVINYTTKQYILLVLLAALRRNAHALYELQPVVLLIRQLIQANDFADAEQCQQALLEVLNACQYSTSPGSGVLNDLIAFCSI